MPEEVREDLAGEPLGRAPLVVDVRAQRRFLSEFGNLRQRVADREEDAVHLRVLVCKKPKVRMSTTVYELRVDDALPMNMSALGTLWSPMWITEEPTQAPMLRCARLRIACIMREVLGAA